MWVIDRAGLKEGTFLHNVPGFALIHESYISHIWGGITGNRIIRDSSTQYPVLPGPDLDLVLLPAPGERTRSSAVLWSRYLARHLNYIIHVGGPSTYSPILLNTSQN